MQIESIYQSLDQVYNHGDLLLLDNGDVVQLHKRYKNEKDFYYGSFIGGLGMYANSNSNSEFCFSTMEDLIACILKYDKIIKHFSSDEYKLQIVKKE